MPDDAKATVAAGRGTVTVAGVEVTPGTRRDTRPVVSELYTGRQVRLPIAVVNGAAPGPRLFVTGAVHGDELVGTAVCRQLLDRLRPDGLAGAVVVVPIVNVLGAQAHRRELPDGRDLNRCFPGTAGGSMAARLARLVVDEVVAESTAGVDLHTAARGRTNVPHVRLDATDPVAERLAGAFAADYTLPCACRPGSLRDAAGDLDVPVVTVEAGGALRTDPRPVEVGTAGLLRVLGVLGMVAEPPSAAPGAGRMLATSQWLRAEHGGLLDLHVAPGDPVRSDQPLWTTNGPLGRARATPVAPHDGVVIGATTRPVVAPGGAVVHLGRPQPGV